MDALAAHSEVVSNVEVSQMIRVCIIDDHLLVAHGLTVLIEAETDMKVVARCATVQEGLQALMNEPADVVLLDSNLGQERGIVLLDQLQNLNLGVRVITIAAVVNCDDVIRLAARGVSGIVLKDGPPSALLQAIRTVAAGDVWFSQRHLQAILRSFADKRVAVAGTGNTVRERAVLSALLEGCTNKEIGVRLGVSETTVKTVLQHLFSKHQVRSRSQLVLIAALERHPELV